jgi:Anti-sigma factor NepR
MASGAVAPPSEFCMSASRTRARGDEELSARKGSETEGAGHSGHSKKSKASDRTARKSDLGRALRTVYDDTVREAIPDDLLRLIGKLS